MEVHSVIIVHLWSSWLFKREMPVAKLHLFLEDLVFSALKCRPEGSSSKRLCPWDVESWMIFLALFFNMKESGPEEWAGEHQ